MKREAMYLKKDQGGAWKEDREREIDVIILWSEKIKEIIFNFWSGAYQAAQASLEFIQ